MRVAPVLLIAVLVSGIAAGLEVVGDRLLLANPPRVGARRIETRSVRSPSVGTTERRAGRRSRTWARQPSGRHSPFEDSNSSAWRPTSRTRAEGDPVR